MLYNIKIGIWNEKTELIFSDLKKMPRRLANANQFYEKKVQKYIIPYASICYYFDYYN